MCVLKDIVAGNVRALLTLDFIRPLFFFFWNFKFWPQGEGGGGGGNWVITSLLPIQWDVHSVGS